MADIVREKSFEFAVKIVNFYKKFSQEKREFILSKQLLRSGTSIGANLREALNAQSDNDFIHKNAIAQKECDETIYWIELLFATDYITEKEFQDLVKEPRELLKIIRSIILTKKQNLKK